MRKLIAQRYIVRQNFILLIGFCLAAYFAYHLVAGPRSYMRLMTLDYQISKTSESYDALSAERQALEHKVVMMRPGGINRDLLEERVRKTLGYTYADEKVIITN